MSLKRTDGRKPTETREINISFEGLDGVDGSARFAFGETKALASVSGPLEVRLAAEQASKATFEVMVRPLSGLAGTESKALASSLRSALLPSMILTNNPRTLIQLVAQSLTPVQNDTFTGPRSSLRLNPSLVASTINASSLALLNSSSFPMRGVVCAVAVGRLKASHALVVDPSEEELPKLDGGGTFSFLLTALPHGTQTVAQLGWSNWTAAPFKEDELLDASRLAQEASKLVYQHMKEAIGHLAFGTTPMREVKKALSGPREVEVDDEKMEIS